MLALAAVFRIAFCVDAGAPALGAAVRAGAHALHAVLSSTALYAAVAAIQSRAVSILATALAGCPTLRTFRRASPLGTHLVCLASHRATAAMVIVAARVDALTRAVTETRFASKFNSLVRATDDCD